MTRSYGIDTSVLVRLLTGKPPAEFTRCISVIGAMAQDRGAGFYASNQVIGEAYVAVQHHYGVSKRDARDGLVDVLQSGLVTAQSGQAALDALEAPGGAGLLDRLIAADYARAGYETLTLDRRMAGLPGVRLL